VGSNWHPGNLLFFHSPQYTQGCQKSCVRPIEPVLFWHAQSGLSWPKTPSDLPQSAAASCCAIVVVVKFIEDRICPDSESLSLNGRRGDSTWNLLTNPEMGRGTVNAEHLFPDCAMEVPIAHNQQVIEAFSPHTSQEPFADRVGQADAERDLEDLG